MEAQSNSTSTTADALRRATPWLLAAITLALFLPALRYDFSSHDDRGYVRDNPYLPDGLSLRAVEGAFTQSIVGSWFPASILSHALDVELWGMNPAGHHASNVLLHLLNTLLLFHVLRTATARHWASAAVALLFAIHPLHVEPVVWISSRKDVLSGFFLLATIWAHLHYARTRAPLWYAVEYALFCIGLLAKSTLVTLPCALLLLDFWPLRRLTSAAEIRRCVLEKLPFFATGAVVIYISAQIIHSDLVAADYRPLSMRFQNAITALGAYLWMTAAPGALSPYYPYPYHWGARECAAAAAVLTVLSAVALATVRSRPYLFTGFFWFAGMFVPMLGLVQYSDHLLGDHYTYVPLIGLFIAIVWLFEDVFTGTRNASARAVLGAAAAGVVLLWLGLAVMQIGLWATPSRLYAQEIERGRPSGIGYMLLGSAHLNEGDASAAMAAYEQSLQLAPNLNAALNDLGMLYAVDRRLAEAESLFARAVAIDPEFATARANLSLVTTEREAAEAELRERESVGDTPSQEDLQRIGELQCMLGRYAEAVEAFRRALASGPEHAVLRYNLANALYRSGDSDGARAEAERALALDPALAPAQELIEGLELDTNAR